MNLAWLEVVQTLSVREVSIQQGTATQDCTSLVGISTRDFQLSIFEVQALSSESKHTGRIPQERLYPAKVWFWKVLSEKKLTGAIYKTVYRHASVKSLRP